MRRLLLLVLAASVPAVAQSVVLGPNTIQGAVRFTNTNPDVLAYLDAEGLTSVQVSASSAQGYSAQTSQIAVGREGGSYQLSAEASNVTYTLSASAAIGGVWNHGTYNFAPLTGQTLQPVSVMPAGLTADFAERAGVVRVKFGTDATCATPAYVSYANIATSRGSSSAVPSNGAPVSHAEYVMQGGLSLTATIDIKMGYDSTKDQITYRLYETFDAPEDGFQDICIPFNAGAGGVLGQIQTPYEVVGHTITGSGYALATNGPQGNYRLEYLLHSFPVSNPAGWLTFPNLVPGGYLAYADGSLDSGSGATDYQTYPTQWISVVAGATTDASVNGQYPWVMHPANYSGTIKLYDAFAAKSFSGSGLSTLAFSMDWPSTQNNVGSVHGPSTGTCLQSNSNWWGWSASSFAGRFSWSSGELDSPYRLPLPSTYDAPEQRQPPYLHLVFASDPALHKDLGNMTGYETPASTPQDTYQAGALNVVRDTAFSTVLPSQELTYDHHYCTSDVYLAYSSTNGKFVTPVAGVSGSFSGTDFEGNATAYTVGGSFYGIPSVGSRVMYNALQYRATQGAVRMTLPQGSYHISPSATFVADNGSTSTGNFAGIDVAVGCGQRISLAPGLALSLDVAPACAENVAAHVVGTITPPAATVTHIWYEIGASTVDVCTGSCPTAFAFDVPPTQHGTLTVHAASGFTEAKASQAVQACDSTPPVITLNAAPASACSPIVTYTASAVDNTDGPVPVSCTPPSGSTFPIGTSTVTCTAHDSFGNVANASFPVSVTWSDAFSGFLAPLDWQRIAPKDQAQPTGIPVKFRLTCNGQKVNVVPRLYWAEGSGASVGPWNEAISKGSANDANFFRAAGDMWIFNLDVRPLGSGVRTLRVDLGDGVDREVVIQVD